MNKLISILLLCLFCSCGNCHIPSKDTEPDSTSASETVKKQWAYMPYDTVFVPDTTINNILFLNNETSIIRNIGNTESLMISDEDYFPYVYFVSKDETQYIKMTIFAGSSLNSFDVFEIGYVRDIQYKIPNKSNFENFYTESGIHLGMHKEEVRKIKGSRFVETKSDGFSIMRYQISEGEKFDGENYKSRFLERNGVGYSASYYFKNNKLVKFSYGFEYP